HIDTGALSSHVAGIVGAHSYLINGISYKAPIIAHIVRECAGETGALRLGDIGGGYGALAAELLLMRESGIASAVTGDPAARNVWLAQSLYLGLYEHLRGRFHFSLGPAEAFPFDAGFDVITYVGSLLYVPKHQLEQTLQATWKGLRPGGLLIVHENIKAP